MVVVEAADCIVLVIDLHFDCADQSEIDDQTFWIGIAAAIVVDIEDFVVPGMQAEQ